MQAQVGDWVIVNRDRLGEPPRKGQILQVQHSDGSPPYLHWLDRELPTLVYPGPDAYVQPREFHDGKATEGRGGGQRSEPSSRGQSSAGRGERRTPRSSER